MATLHHIDGYLVVVPATREECELIDDALTDEPPGVLAGWITYGPDGDEPLRLTLSCPANGTEEVWPEPPPTLRSDFLRILRRFLEWALREEQPMELVDTEDQQ